MENLNLLELKKVDTNKVVSALFNEFRTEYDLFNAYLKSFVCTYVIYKMQNTIQYDSVDEFMDNIDLSDEQKLIIFDNVHDCWDLIISNLLKFSSYELLAFILFYNPPFGKKSPSISTPKGILNLTLSILDLKDSDEILELCSGTGNFIVEAITNGYLGEYTGVEINYNAKFISELRTSIINDNYQYVLGDAIEYRGKNKFDKIFAHFPFMLKNSLSESLKNEILSMGLSFDILKKSSMDWLFNLAIIDQLKDGGKAVAVMTNGSTWNSNDEKMRQYFVEKGYIETVIALPPNLLEDTSISVALYVLSHNNKEVRLVDAKNVFTKERRKNILTAENVEDILNMLEVDSEYSITKTIKELSQNEYILNASRYVELLPAIENGVEFGTVIKSITRGFQLKASDLEEYKSSTPTYFQYIMLSNIDNGIITLNNENQYLKRIPDKLEKYCVKNNSMVLSKVGVSTFKSAVAQIDGDTTVIANGNLFLIELDEEIVNPFYIQALFNSDLGDRLLKSVCTGTLIPTIHLDKLQKMIIPLPTLKEQEIIGNKYADAIDQLILMNRKIEKIKNRLPHIFNEE